jgi:hypothetical protein
VVSSSSTVDEVLSSIVVDVAPLRLVEDELSSTLVDDPLSSRLVDVLGVVVLVAESSDPLAHAIPATSNVAATTPPTVATVLFCMLNLLGFRTVQSMRETPSSGPQKTVKELLRLVSR